MSPNVWVVGLEGVLNMYSGGVCQKIKRKPERAKHCVRHCFRFCPRCHVVLNIFRCWPWNPSMVTLGSYRCCAVLTTKNKTNVCCRSEQLALHGSLHALMDVMSHKVITQGRRTAVPIDPSGTDCVRLGLSLSPWS